MIKEYKTISDCARLWASEFDAIQTEMIAKLIQADPDSWHEMTLPAVGDTVNVYSLPEGADDFGEYSVFRFLLLLLRLHAGSVHQRRPQYHINGHQKQPGTA